MSTTLDPIILGPIMVTFLVLWFAWVSVMLGEPKETPRASAEGVTELRRRDEPARSGSEPGERGSRAA